MNIKLNQPVTIKTVQMKKQKMKRVYFISGNKSKMWIELPENEDAEREIKSMGYKNITIIK